MGTFGPNQLAAMPETPPPVERPYRTLVLGLPPYRDGVYTVDQLSMFDAMPLPQAPEPRLARSQVPDLGQLVADIDVAVFAADHGEAAALMTALARDFERLDSDPPRRMFMNRSLRLARQHR